MTIKIKKNDMVLVLTGASRGTKGKVLRVFPEDHRVLVEGVNIKKKHVRTGRSDKKDVAGRIVEKNFPIHISNVSLIDPKSGKPTRVGWQRDEKKGKIRIAKKSGSVL